MSLQERLEIIRSSPTPRGEEQAKFQIIAPILQNLGWDPSEVLLEYWAGGKRSGGRIDLALKAAGRIVALIEAKAPGSNLHDHVDQVIGYAHHEGVDVCILTTGLEWWLFLPRERGRPPKRRFAVLHLIEDPPEELAADLATFLGRESLVNGQAEELAKIRLEHVHLNSEVPPIWDQMLHEPDAELVGLVQRRVHERAHLRLTKAQVAAALQGSPIPSTTVPTDPGTAPRTAAPSVTGPSGLTWTPWPKATAIVLWGERYPVSGYVDAWRKFLDVIYERHRDDFSPVLGIRGTKYPHVARNPESLHKEGRTYHHEPKSSGYFFAIPNSADGFEKRARRFLACLGHSDSDFKVLHD